MAFNFKLPCAVTCSIIFLRCVRQVKNNNVERRNYPKGQINNFLVYLLYLVGTPTCQSSSLLISLLESKHIRGFYRLPEKLKILIIVPALGGPGILPG